MTEHATFSPDWVCPPGEILEEYAEENNWSQKELAERLGLSAKHLNQIIKGKASITEQTALALEKVLGSPASFWLKLESNYQQDLARKAEEEKLLEDKEWLQEIPLNDMIKMGWLAKKTDKAKQIIEALKFFGVASISAWRNTYTSPIAAFKSSTAYEASTGATAAWIRQGEIIAQTIETKPYNAKKLKSNLNLIRQLTNEPDPKIFIPRLQELCANAGVAVVFLPAPKGCRASGATKWLSQDKALVMLSLRHKTNDHLWFAFFHEIGHILLHSKKLMFIEDDNINNEHELEADAFASNILIPSEYADKLSELPLNTPAIIEFAKSIGAAPAIIVGRMQHDGLINWSHPLGRLKITYQWS